MLWNSQDFGSKLFNNPQNNKESIENKESSWFELLHKMFDQRYFLSMKVLKHKNLHKVKRLTLNRSKIQTLLFSIKKLEDDNEKNEDFIYPLTTLTYVS